MRSSSGREELSALRSSSYLRTPCTSRGKIRLIGSILDDVAIDKALVRKPEPAVRSRCSAATAGRLGLGCLDRSQSRLTEPFSSGAQGGLRSSDDLATEMCRDSSRSRGSAIVSAAPVATRVHALPGVECPCGITDEVGQVDRRADPVRVEHRRRPDRADTRMVLRRLRLDVGDRVERFRADGYRLCIVEHCRRRRRLGHSRRFPGTSQAGAPTGSLNASRSSSG